MLVGTSHSDDVRAFAFERYIRPTREKNQPLVIIRAGDVADALGLQKSLPKVCGALGATSFEADFSVRRVYVHGPLNGANTYFVFDVKPSV